MDELRGKAFNEVNLFHVQMVINLAPVSLSNKIVNFYTCPRLNFLKKNATENAYKSISEPLDFNMFWGGMPPDPPNGSRPPRSKLALSCSEVWLQPCFLEMVPYQGSLFEQGLGISSGCYEHFPLATFMGYEWKVEPNQIPHLLSVLLIR